MSSQMSPNDATTSSRQAILTALSSMVEPLNQSLIGPSEVVLHDLSKLPNSIVAIAGHLTQRPVGGPTTDRMLQSWFAGTLRTEISYATTLSDGRALRSTTIVIDDEAGSFAAVCLNVDVSIWQGINDITTAIVNGDRWPGLPQLRTKSAPNEKFAHDIDEFATCLLNHAVHASGVPVKLMRKEHKLRVISDLKSRGFFLLKDSVDAAATALQVTRFTIYNYLNELDANQASPDSHTTSPN